MAHFIWSRHQEDFYSESWLTDTEDLAELAARILPTHWLAHRSPHYFYFSPKGSRLASDGWKIHVSSQVRDAQEIITRVIDLLSHSGTSFKLLKSSKLLRFYNGRFIPRSASGKFITIYPRDADLARELVLGLEDRLFDKRAVQVLTDDQRLDAPVSYRYGAFAARWRVGQSEAEAVTADPSGQERHDTRQTYFQSPENIAPLFPGETEPDEALDRLPAYSDILQGRWAAIDTISSTNLGAIYRGQDLVTGHAIIIKERRGYVEETDPSTLLRRAHSAEDLARRMGQANKTPQILDVFTEWQNVYTVSEYRDGIHLGHFANLEHPGIRNRNDPDLWLRYQVRVIEIGQKLCDTLVGFHANGILLNDVSVTNFIVELGDGTISFVDLEDCLRIDHHIAAAEAITTPGFFPANQIPSTQTDVYGLARVLHYLLIPIPNGLVFRSEGEGNFESTLLDLVQPHPALKEWLLTTLSKGWTTESPQEIQTELSRIVKVLKNAISRPYYPREKSLSYLHISGQYDDASGLTRQNMNANLIEVDELASELTTSLENYLGNSSHEHQRILQPVTPPQSVGNLANGVSGIAIALHERNPDSNLSQKLVESCRDVRHVLPGLMSGAAGLALSAAKVGLPDIAETHAQYATSFTQMDDSALSLSSGRAGIILALTAVSATTGSNAWLDKADRLAQHVAERVSSWPEPSSMSEYDATPGGFLEGPAGIAFALHSLGLRTAQDSYRPTVERLMRIALSSVSYTPSGGLSTPTDEDGQVLSHYFGDGTSGLLYALRYTRLEHIVSPDTLIRLAEDCTRPFTSFGGLISGQTGLAMPFTVQSREADPEADLARALHVFASLNAFRRTSKDGNALFLGPVNLKASLDLAGGAAGALLVANRLIARFDGKRNNQLKDEGEA